MVNEEFLRKQGIHFLPQAEYDKAVGQLRLQLNGVMSPFRFYGQDVFVGQAVEEIIKLCEDFGLRVRGVDKPLSLELIRRNEGSINGRK